MRVALLSLFAALAACAAAVHTEELYVRPLPHAHKTLAHFRFATDERGHETDSLYPTVVRQILSKYDAASIRLTMAVGQYADELYGPPYTTSNGSSLHAPFGARLQVEFAGDKSASGPFMDRWKGVTSELGGVFSASLNQMDESTIATVLPGSSAAEFGAVGTTTPPGHFVQATLAREELCTENLTPWLKMLPCRAHAGLGALIDPIKILSGEYASLSIFASRDAVSGVWHFDQQLTTVQDVRDDSWSLQSLLHDSSAPSSSSVDACPLAGKSLIKTQLGAGIETTDIKALSDGVVTTTPWLGDSQLHQPTHPRDVVTAHRFQTGYGQVHGGVAVRLENRHSTCVMRVTYNDVTPWYMRLYFHTFKSRVLSLDDESTALPDTTPSFDFIPAELRGRPNQLRVQVDLPPQSALVLSIKFEKVFVRLSEHPPDANRGFDIPPGVAVFTPASHTCKPALRHVVYSEPLLVALPTPDFSMPYNVITLTSTIVAFFVGSMLNTLLRKAPRIQRMLADDATKPKTQ